MRIPVPEAPSPGDSSYTSVLQDMPVSYDFRPSYWAKLEALLARASDVCVGVVGLPGAGKTTLLRLVSDGGLSSERDRPFRFMVSAPASGDPLEIARQLVHGVCLALMREVAGMRLRRAPAGIRRQVIVASAATIAGAALLVLSAERLHINAQAGVGAALVLAGIVGLLSRLTCHAARLTRTGRAALTRRFGADDRVRRPRELYERAASLLEALEAERRFETTVTSGWTTGLTPSPGVAFGATGSVSKKILPMSLYELAEQYSALQ